MESIAGTLTNNSMYVEACMVPWLGICFLLFAPGNGEVCMDFLALSLYAVYDRVGWGFVVLRHSVTHHLIFEMLRDDDLVPETNPSNCFVNKEIKKGGMKCK